MTETKAPHPRVGGALAAAGVAYTVRRHGDCPFPIRSPQDFARCLGRPVDAITKTLFLEIATQEAPAGFALAVCPVPCRADFDLLARHWNAALVRLGRRNDVATMLEYPPNSVSPLGCDGFRVAIDEAVYAHATVLVGGGVTGVEIEINPEDLRRACGGTRLAFAHL